MEQEIKPCPFCGEADIFVNSSYSARTYKFYNWIECVRCGTRTRAVTSDEPFTIFAENLAAARLRAAWNARAGDAE